MRTISQVFYATVLAATFCACKKDSDKPAPQLSVDRPAISLGVFQGYVDSFEVQSNSAWELEVSPASAAEWLQMSTTQGKAGKTVVKVSTIAANATTQTATISVKPEGSTTASAEVEVTQRLYAADWNKIAGGDKTDEFKSMARTADGGLVVAGYTLSDANGDMPAGHGNYEGFVMKMTASGSIDWIKSFGGKDLDIFNSIAVTADGGFIACGVTESDNDGDVPAGHGYVDAWVVRLNANGVILWSKSYGGDGYDEGRYVAVAPDGGFVIAGETSSNNNGDVGPSIGHGDLWAFKLDESGNILWSNVLGGSSYDYAKYIITTADGSSIITAATHSNNSGNVGPTLGETDAWVVKLGANGNIVWNKTFGGSDYDEIYGISVTPDNGFVLAGHTQSVNSGDIGENKGMSDAWILKIDASGNKVWSRTYGGDHWDVMTQIAVTLKGDLLVSGFTDSHDSGEVGPTQGGVDIWLLQLNSMGGMMWNKAIGGNKSDFSLGLVTSDNGEFIVGGGTNSNGTGDVGATHGDYDIWLVKFK